VRIESPSEPDPIPSNLVAFYASQLPHQPTSFPSVARPTDADVLIRRADERFASGRKALQEQRVDDARKEFDKALEVLMTAPENMQDRTRVERRLDQLVESIYRYDLDQLAAGEPDEQGFEAPPLEDLIEMTFPIDPSLRHKVQEQIRMTASQLPLEQSDSVVGLINFFSSARGKRILEYGLRRAGRYRPMIQRILAEEGVPQELIFLAQAESGFSPRAVSRARCVGIWQFAQFRGREYGLNQSSATDDRMDPEQATRAAARHLRDLYQHFGDWYLAMAAYNCGPGCVDHAIMRTGYADFWELKRLGVLPKETANYVPAILAMTIMSKNAADYGLSLEDTEPPLEYDTIELESPTHLALIAEAVDRSISELKELNPSLLRLVAPAGHSIHVPKGTMEQVQAVFQAIPVNHRDSWRAHKMEETENLADLAKRFNTTTNALNAANHDEMPGAGSWMAIPVSYPVERPAVKATARTSASARSRVAGKSAASPVKPAVKVRSSNAKPGTASGL
jgi:membrane-bound lytic murein transglycosylase D